MGQSEMEWLQTEENEMAIQQIIIIYLRVYSPHLARIRKFSDSRKKKVFITI